MKLFFIANGDSIHSYKWVSFFASGGHEVHWASLTPFANSLPKGFQYEITGNPLRCLVRLRGLAARLNPDVVHAHYAGMNGAMGAFVGFHPFVLTAWGSDILMAGRHWLKRPLIWHALRRADLVTCDADHMKKAIMEFGIPDRKIELIYFGIDTKRFCPGEKNLALAERLNIRGRQVVLSMRNFEPVYNIETLVRAIPLVVQTCPDVLFLFGGRGSERGMLQRLIEELGVGRSAAFLGWVSNEDLPSYLRLSAISVSTALSDGGISGTTAEAMACGVPVVITDSGENSLWVKDGRDGFVVPVKNPELLAERIITLLQSAELQQQFGERGREIIRQRNDYETEMKRMERLYMNLAQKNGTHENDS